MNLLDRSLDCHFSASAVELVCKKHRKAGTDVVVRIRKRVVQIPKERPSRGSVVPITTN
jgi:hypothetical protein